MEIEFDAAKDELNRAKHGISLSEAVGLGWDSLELSRICGATMAKRGRSAMRSWRPGCIA